MLFKWSIGFYLSHAQSDTIIPDGLIGFEDSLVLANGRFRLYFVRVVDSVNGDYRYLRIRYNEAGAVWVANWTSPVYGRSGNFTMDRDGLLMIMHDYGNPIILNPDRVLRSSSATLQDDGNFIVTQLNPDGSSRRILWESFGFPTDSLLRRMKLGENFQNGRKWTLLP